MLEGPASAGAGGGDTLFGLHVLLVGPLVEWAGPLHPASAGRGSVCARHAVKRGDAVQMQHGHTTRQLCFHAGPACLLCGLGVCATRRSIFGRSWLGQRICGALIRAVRIRPSGAASGCSFLHSPALCACVWFCIFHAKANACRSLDVLLSVGARLYTTLHLRASAGQTGAVSHTGVLKRIKK